MAKLQEQSKAMRLRKSGYSISAIAKTLSVSKSTASGWCRDIALTERQLEQIAEKSKHHATLSLLKSSENQRKVRQENIKRATQIGKRDVGKLSQRDVHMIGLGLYWGEGYKKGNQELGFTNSDPGMITFYIHWLRTVYGIEKKDLILRVSINNQHAERITDIVQYWSLITGISTTQFTKTSLIKIRSKKIYENLHTHFGTLRIKVRRGTELRRRILGSIQALKIK